MVDPSSRNVAVEERSRWRYLLPLVWAALGAWITVAIKRGTSLHDDFMSLALISFFMTTAVLGSRVWLWFHDRWDRLTGRPAASTALGGDLTGRSAGRS